MMESAERAENASPQMFFVVEEEERLDEDLIYVPAHLDPVEIVIEDIEIVPNREPPDDGRDVDENEAHDEVPPEPEAYIEIADIQQVLANQQPEPEPPQSNSRNHPETPKTSKKRKRSSPLKSATPKPPPPVPDDDDDGTICPICLDSWEMSGDHRLTSLKCGHLFGHACIRRWIQECLVGSKTCPSCKTKATLKDIRFLYAKKICVVDNSEEIRLRDCLEMERKKFAALQMEYGIAKMELDIQRNLCTELQLKLMSTASHSSLNDISNVSQMESGKLGFSYKLFLEKNIDICREPGCRVMAYGQASKTLLVSQKSIQSLFPGYGVRFIDVPTFRPSSFLHMSGKTVRDLSFDMDEELFISATMERGAKLFNIHTKSVVNVFTPSEDPLWACAFDVERSKFLYLGTQKGSTYVYDIRNGDTFIQEFKMEGDYSPVINISSVPPINAFPFGGFLVCKLQSLWFYEYKTDQTVETTKLNIEGPFINMSFDVKTNHVLISARPNSKYQTSRYVIADLIKIDGHLSALKIVETYNGSKVQSVMSRSTQIAMEGNVLVAAYLQDTKMLTTWNTGMGNRKVQSLPVSDVVLDMCPIYVDKQVYLGALTDCKCRIYKVCSNN